MYKTTTFFLAILFLISCGNKKADSVINDQNEIIVADTISGFYKTEIDTNETESCELSVEIYENKYGYTYHLKTDLRDVRGNVSFNKDNPKELYILFEGIKWDDYSGDVSREIDNDETNDDVEKENVEIPIGIEAFFHNDTLTIQNYGNSMNSYTVLGECNRKYIRLIKQNHR